MSTKEKGKVFIMDFETILQKLTGYKKVFKKDGELSNSGYKAYSKCIDILCNFVDLGILTREECDRAIREIDKILAS